MLASISSHAPIGIDGIIITVEVDIRRGIPGIDIIGLPDGAIREAKERVRVAIKNSGFRMPAERILVSLAPAGLKKEGALYDLPIALCILAACGQFHSAQGCHIMVIGELNLSGKVRPVIGVLAAVSAGIRHEINSFLVPRENLREALALRSGHIFGISSLREAASAFSCILSDNSPDCMNIDAAAEDSAKEISSKDNTLPEKEYYDPAYFGDFADIKGHHMLKRAMEVAAAGRHHVFIFGPPGSGKTMAVQRFPSILPDLHRDESISVTSIHSIAGILPNECGLIRRPPFRSPHHSASPEGITGGGAIPKPGEVSLAHEGVLFLDEAPEFRQTLLQTLREPVEEGRITLSRAGISIQFPSDFQLILAANPCPCGNLGNDSGVCVCTHVEIQRYWRKLGGALLDRIDIRIPLKPVSAQQMQEHENQGSLEIRKRVEHAVQAQEARFGNSKFKRNGRIPPGMIEHFIPLDAACSSLLNESMKKMTLSSRAYHSILKVARTVADIEGEENLSPQHILEAIQHRRYGDSDIFWNC